MQLASVKKVTLKNYCLSKVWTKTCGSLTNKEVTLQGMLFFHDMVLVAETERKLHQNLGICQEQELRK